MALSGGAGDLLRHWRQARRKSQLALALEANVSSRHISFIETGRAKPSRQMVLHLARALDIPLRERNLLLAAAGFTPAYRESGLDAPEMALVQQALESILRQQEPHPAVIMDRHWNVLSANEGAGRLFSRFIDLDTLPQPINILRLMFDPHGIRPFVSNWDEVAEGLLGRIAREAVCGVPDAGLAGLLEELKSFPGMPMAIDPPLASGAGLPIIPVRFRDGSFEASYFSTVTTLGTPLDVSLQEIRIECFFPCDDQEKLRTPPPIPF